VSTFDVHNFMHLVNLLCLQAGSLAKKGLHELDAVLSHITLLGCKFPVREGLLCDNMSNVISY